MNPFNLTPEAFQEIIRNRAVRRSITYDSHLWFFHLYFNHYVRFETAAFQKEMFALSEDEAVPLAVIVAFRGSAKSTVMTLSYPIWAILGKPQKKFILLISQTQNQARQMLTNLKRELEGNELLRADLGPFEEETDEWGSTSLVLPAHNAKIMAVSSEQSIRGFRHGQYRPDLIIADDVEDLASVKTREGRDKIHQWFTGEVIPCGDMSTKIVVVGNLLHEDSLLMRLRKSIEDEKLSGVFRSYPLLDGNDTCLWPGKFKSLADIETLKKSVGSEASFQREFLLRIIADSDRVIQPGWIQYYDYVPSETDSSSEFRYAATAIDLAISQKDSADYTAMVSGKVFNYAEKQVIFILPNPVNERLTPLEQVERAKALSRSLGNGIMTQLYVEEVGYQGALTQLLNVEGYPAEGVRVGGQDKRARLALTTSLIQSGKVLFPRHGCEELIAQLVGFGVEKHDDLADAFTMLVLKCIADNEAPFEMFFLESSSGTYRGLHDDWGDDDDDLPPGWHVQGRWNLRC